MTVASTTNKHSYNGNASQAAFAYTFKIFADADIKVFVGTALKTLNTHYTLSGVGATSGGNVTFTSGNIPAAGTGNVTLLRTLALTQGVDLINYGKFDAEVVESQYDKLTMMVQQLQEQADRTIRFSTTVSDAGGVEITDTVAERSGKVLAYDANGDLSVANELGDWQGNWTSSRTYAVRDLALDAATNNVYTCLISHTSGTLSSDVSANKWALVINAAAVAASATTATTKASEAAASATTATNQASTATTKASEAATSASTATTKANTATTQASTATTKASEANTSASNAATSASAAATSNTNSGNSATAAASSASTANTKASEASTSASTATTKANQASSSASAAATSNTNSGNSATASANSATAAASSASTANTKASQATTSANNAASSLASFTGQYVSQSGAPASPSTGDLWFDTSSSTMKVYNGSAFANAGSSVNGVENAVQHTATAGQTSFSATYDAGHLQVFLNGIRLDTADYTATNGNAVVLAIAAAVGDVVFIQGFGTFVLADVYTKSVSDGRFKAIGALEGGPSLGTNSILRYNANTINENISVSSGLNAFSAGPITIANNKTVTIANNATWSII